MGTGRRGAAAGCAATHGPRRRLWSVSTDTNESPARRRPGREHRLAPALAVAAAAAIYGLLPESLLFAPRYIIPLIEMALLVSLLITNPYRMVRSARWSRILSITLAGVVILANLTALVMLITTLGDPAAAGAALLVAAMQVWVTNVIGFSLLYWEIDRGGPVLRREAARSDLPVADWRFSQDENDAAVTEVAAGASGRSDWVPTFIDYLYMSLTNSSAFSPTDTMPLSTRAKVLMGVQATAALLTSLLVIARAVGALGGGG